MYELDEQHLLHEPDAVQASKEKSISYHIMEAPSSILRSERISPIRQESRFKCEFPNTQLLISQEIFLAVIF